MWAWCAIDPSDDCEGIIGMHTPEGWMPLVGADGDRMASLRHVAVAAARANNVVVSLVKFTNREVVELVSPPSTN